MALAAKISAAELSAQVTNRFKDQYFEARLINAPGVSYVPGTTDDVAFLANEVTIGTGGYQRQSFSYTVSDIATYSDGGVGLAQKATIFSHDGGATTIDFTHVALVWSDGNVTAVSSNPTSSPTAATNGSYTGIPIDSTDGSGVGGSLDLVVIGNGANSTDYALTIATPGYGYAEGDTVTVTEGTLAGLGIVAAGAGDLEAEITTVHSAGNAGDLLSVARTTNAVVLGAGNEAAFYWNLKQYGYYESLLAAV